MSSGKSFTKKISIIIFIIMFAVMGWLKWNNSQNQTKIDSNTEPRWLLFHSTKCEACEKMLDLSAKLEDEYTGRVEFIHIDIYDTSNEKITSDYKISFIPTSVFEVGGKEPITKIGAISEDELRKLLDDLVKNNE